MPTLAEYLINARAQAATPPLHWWQGQSGGWYPHSIYNIAGPYSPCAMNYVMVRRNADGSRDAIYIGETSNGADRFPQHEKLLPALLMGANELHVHFLATNETERLMIETDLRHGHQSALNQQDRPFQAPGLRSYFASKMAQSSKANKY